MIKAEHTPGFGDYFAGEPDFGQENARQVGDKAGTNFLNSTNLAYQNKATDASSNQKKPPSVVQTLIGLASGATLFHAPDGEAFADILTGGHRETWPIRSAGFRSWLTREYFFKTKFGAAGDALGAAIATIEAMAVHDGHELPVCTRATNHAGKIYVSLCDHAWRIIEIDSAGWRICANSPIRFRRSKGLAALPMPETGGKISELRRFLNIRTDADFALCVAWLLAGLRGAGPFPILALRGEQGCAKSTATRILRALVDPNAAPARTMPREDRDLFLSAKNSHVLAFDNISAIPGWLSDTFCQLSTGGGFSSRKLFTDSDETIFQACNPIILNGIGQFITRPDLADRTIQISLKPIVERRTERELWAEFDAVRGRILGALFGALAIGLARQDDSDAGRPQVRMADFASWARACEPGFAAPGAFLASYRESLAHANEGILDDEPVAVAVRAILEKSGRWTGTASELWAAMAKLAADGERAPGLPRDARALSERLSRLKPALRAVGILIEVSREGPARTKIITIWQKSASGLRPFASGLRSPPERLTH